MPSVLEKYTCCKALPDSYKEAVLNAIKKEIDPTEIIDVSVRICGKETEPDVINKIRYSKENYEKEYTFDDDVLQQIRLFCACFDLKIYELNKEENNIVLRGEIKDFELAFKVSLFSYEDNNSNNFRAREGYIYIPEELEDKVEGVYGLDTRPAAKSHCIAESRHKPFPSRKSGRGYFARDVGRLYNFPNDADGAGQCIGIIALGGGYRIEDINNYFLTIGLATPDILPVSINGAQNSPTIPDSHDKEVMLDILVAASIAPKAKIVVYFAQNNDKGFLDAVTKAVYDKINKPSVISISWGNPEKKWTKQSLKSFNNVFKAAASMGITICAATGDAGSSDGIHDGKVHVDFPASSPYVLACGGTYLVAKNEKIISEVVWHESDHAAGGGGISEVFPLPDYQQNANIPLSLNPSGYRGRGIPDVAANAAYSTGYRIPVNGFWMILGGTSAVAPLYAGLVALLNQKKGSSYGFINPYLYENPNLFREIVKGNNITARPYLGYKAAPGWNACTGLGVVAAI